MLRALKYIVLIPYWLFLIGVFLAFLVSSTTLSILLRILLGKKAHSPTMAIYKFWSALFFLVAGIASHWVNTETGETMGTFAIVTCPSGPLMSNIHNSKKRQPLILTPGNWLSWIEGAEDQALELVRPCSDDLLQAIPISPLASHVRENRNVPEVQSPWVYPELSPGLF